MLTKVRILGALVVVSTLAIRSGVAVAADATPEKYLELLRSDVQTAKVGILTEALNLTQAQADAFWPIHRQYETELSVLGDRRVALIKRFAEKYGTMSDVDADAVAKEWFGLHKERLKLREKYYGKVAKATSNLIAVRFIQVENAIGMLIDLQIAAELPLLE